MAKCDLSIQLEDQQEIYRTGDVVRGYVEVRADEEVTCKGLTVTCRWRTRGRGNSVHGEGEEQQVFEGTWRAGMVQRYPFAFELPAGPYSYQGHYLNVSWEIHARADVPWAFDPKAEREFALAPAPEAEPDWLTAVALPDHLGRKLRNIAKGEPPDAMPPSTSGPVGKVVGNVLAIGCLLALAALLVVPMVLGISRGLAVYRGDIHWAEGIGWMIGGGVCALILLGGLFTGLRNLVAQRKLGEVVFEVAPRLVRSGDELRVKVFCQPKTESELQRATALLKAEERVVRGSGTNKTTYKHTVFEEELEISVRRNLSKGLPFQAERAITLPADAPPSFYARDNQLEWTLTLHLDVARWPDWKDEAELLVHP